MTASAKPTRPPAPEQADPLSLAPPPDRLRELVHTMLQEMLDEEFTRFLGADRYERRPERRGYRNGVRARTLTTRVGPLRLEIPRDRAGLFRPSLFARYERSEQALVLAMVEMYFQGVSTRKVTEIVEVLCGTSVSASEVSALTRKLEVPLSAWRARPLVDRYRYLTLDAHVERVRREGHVRPTAALWVVGVTAAGYREHLGVWLGTSESAASWGEVFRDLTARGLTGVEYVVADDHLGLGAALARYFPDARLQRCQVHYLRNALDKVSSEALRARAHTGLADAWNAATRPEAEARLAQLVAELEPLAPRLAEWLADTAAETLTCYLLDDPFVRRKLRSTNAVERHHVEVRRRTHVIRIFPHEASLLRLLTALAIEQNDHWTNRRWILASKRFSLALATPEPAMQRLA